MTRTFAILAVCSASLLGACFGIDGNGHRTRETRDVRDFVRLEDNGQLDVEVRVGDDPSVVVSIDSNLQRHVDLHVRDETLIIDTDAHLFDYVSGPHVIITVPHLIFARVTGSGDVDVQGFDETETVRLEASGSGEMRFDGSAPRIEGDVDGSGSMRIKGSTVFADLKVSGSGDLDARDLQADGAHLRCSGSGDLRATVNGDVDAESSGSGDIQLYGDAHLTHSETHGSGDIRRH